jgi:uridine kinase
VDLVTRLADLIEVRRRNQVRLIVGVDGPDAAGKTTLSAEVAAAIRARAVRATIDDFQRLRAHRHARGRLSAEGYYLDGFDHDRLRAELLEPFRRGERLVRLASHDYDGDRAVDRRATVAPAAVLIVDGVFLQRPELAECWDLMMYLDISPPQSLERGVARDAGRFASRDAAVETYQARYLGGQELYRRAVDPAASADVVIDNGDPLSPLIVRWPDKTGH